MRGRGHGDLRDARGARGGDAHDHRGRVRLAAAGRVDGGARHRDLAQAHAVALREHHVAVLPDALLRDRAHVGERRLEPGAHGRLERGERGVELLLAAPGAARRRRRSGARACAARRRRPPAPRR